jgi:hypothetical protein
MIRLGFRVLQIFVNRLHATSASLPELDFSNSANSGYRGFYF